MSQNQHTSVEMAAIDLPDFGLPETEPVLGADTYRRRIERVCAAAGEVGFDLLLVYGDREHSANLSYLTGYDPRFEEALLLLDLKRSDRVPRLLVGNEGIGYVETSPIRGDLEVELCQSLSLLGQDRSRSRFLETILADCGVDHGAVVGTAGWKHYGSAEGSSPETMIEIPSYVVDLLRQLTGDRGNVRNANALFMDASHGVRVHNEIEQLAWFEFAGTYASTAVKRVILGLSPGMSEFEAAELMRLNGIPLSCHPMLSAGDRATYGMGSPGSRRMIEGDRFTTAIGLWGALTSRAGFLVSSADGLPDDAKEYVDRLVAPYFGAISEWYRTIGIGVTGGELFEIIDRAIGDEFFGVSLNPGHQIHLDEWVNSPIYRGSDETLVSGMALQVDVIPATGGPYYTTNIEDGVLLADEGTREAFAQGYPDAWRRITERRDFMAKSLGIVLKPEVLPTSNIPAWLPPYLLAPERVMRVSGGNGR